jgi:hypothetical protein
MVIDPRLGERQCQDGQIYVKLKYLSARRIRPFELMCLTQFLPGAHNVLLDDHKDTRFPPLARFLSMQRIGEYDHRRLGYQKLHKEVDRINSMVR